jgi:hypothetical protein
MKVQFIYISVTHLYYIVIFLFYKAILLEYSTMLDRSFPIIIHSEIYFKLIIKFVLYNQHHCCCHVIYFLKW